MLGRVRNVTRHFLGIFNHGIVPMRDEYIIWTYHPASKPVTFRRDRGFLPPSTVSFADFFRNTIDGSRVALLCMGKDGISVDAESWAAFQERYAALTITLIIAHDRASPGPIGPNYHYFNRGKFFAQFSLEVLQRHIRNQVPDPDPDYVTLLQEWAIKNRKRAAIGAAMQDFAPDNDHFRSNDLLPEPA